MRPTIDSRHLLLLLPWLLAVPVRAGSVTGTVTVERARILSEGPKSEKDVVVFLEPRARGTFPASSRHAEMDQKGLVFIPHVMAVQKGTPVDFLNSDNDRHNVYFLFEKTGETLDIGTWGPGQTVSHTFEDAGVVITLCQLHLEMAAYILVFEHPFYRVAELDSQTQSATFEFDRVPAGRYLLKVWHKKLKQKGKPVEITIGDESEIQADLTITKSRYAK